MMGFLDRSTFRSCTVRLEEFVPADHLLRRVDQRLDLTPVVAELRPYYASTGRPSIAPELMLRMLLIGYLYGIRSERRLVEEVRLNLAYRWFWAWFRIRPFWVTRDARKLPTCEGRISFGNGLIAGGG